MNRFQVEETSRVLVVEDDDSERIPYFRERLPQALIIRNPLIAIEALKVGTFDVIFLDHDLPCTEYRTGLDVARHLAQTGFSGSVVIHSANAIGAMRIADVLQRAGIQFMRAEFSTFTVNEPEPMLFDLGEID